MDQTHNTCTFESGIESMSVLEQIVAILIQCPETHLISQAK